MSDTEPRGVPSGGSDLSGDDAGNAGTAGSDALSGDAGLAGSDPLTGDEGLADDDALGRLDGAADGSEHQGQPLSEGEGERGGIAGGEGDALSEKSTTDPQVDRDNVEDV